MFSCPYTLCNPAMLMKLTINTVQNYTFPRDPLLIHSKFLTILLVQRQFLYYIIQQVLMEVQNVFYPNSFQDCVLVEDCLAL